ncbi:MAG: hypothetical protein FWC48_04025, partial [Actinomycetia bacterium]|nr:hypothetical protein [Actinomycetes bacterium]
VSFPTQTYSAPGTYTYTIAEVAGSDRHLTYDNSAYTATVVVTQAASGVLTAGAPTYAKNGTAVAGAAFANVFTADPVTTVLSASKTMTGGRVLSDGEFGFTLTPISPVQGASIVASNSADGSVSFPVQSFSGPGTYTYQIAENLPAAPDRHIAYDDSVYTAVVTVTQDHVTGALSVASVLYYEGVAPVDSAAFTNVYTADPVSTVLSASKVLSGGKDLTDGEFSFVLKDAVMGDILQTQANDAAGAIDFAALSFEGPGTYTYTISEMAGSDSHITYDGSVDTVTVVVSQASSGVLSVDSVTDSKDGAPASAVAFTNDFTPDPVKATPMSSKALKGKKLDNGEFNFELKDAQGKVVETVSNTADGQVPFKALSFETTGTFVYTISEAPGSDKQITYDASVYRMIADVTEDPATGALSVKLSYVKDGVESKDAAFTNTYTPPKKGLPGTGDATAVGSYWLTLGALGLGAALLFEIDRRRRRSPKAAH